MQTKAVKPEELTSLSQGSIVDLSTVTFNDEGNQKSFFDFYKVTPVKWAIVMTQDCDLENEDKVEYITVGLLDPFHKRAEKFIDDFENTVSKEFISSGLGQAFYEKDSLARWAASKFKKIIENNHNYYIFLTLPEDQEKFYVVNLTKIFSLKIEHKDVLRQHCKYVVTNGFNYLLGWKLAYLYGRVGVDNYGEDRVTIGKALAPQIVTAVKNKIGGQYFAIEHDQKQYLETLITSLDQATTQLETKEQQFKQAPDNLKEARKQSFEKQQTKVLDLKKDLLDFVESLVCKRLIIAMFSI